MRFVLPLVQSFVFRTLKVRKVICENEKKAVSYHRFNNNAKFGKVLETTQQFTKKAPIDVTRRALFWSDDSQTNVVAVFSDSSQTNVVAV